MSDSSKRRALGRGLDALITSTGPESYGAPPDTNSDALHFAVRYVPVASIEPNPRQPRTVFEAEALDELAASMREHGIIQPLILTVNLQRPDLFWLVAGERRWRAAQRAGLQTVPAIVREATPQQLVELALIENVQRADLNPLEEANAYQTLLSEFGLTQAQLAERVGKSRPAVANTLRLLGLPEDLQRMLVEGVLTAGHARAILALPNVELMHAAANEVARKSLNVRQAEALVKRLVEAANKTSDEGEPAVDPQIRAQVASMEERFRTALGTRVTLNRNPDGSGRLVVHFYSDSDLNTLFHLIADDDEV
jgi:ParB family chromosome partitioning protein